MVANDDRHILMLGWQRNDQRKKAAPSKRGGPPPVRFETAHQRQLPDFIIIGTQRGGTTSLYNYLTEHSAIGAAYNKEIHYFDRHYGNGILWYRAYFPLCGEFPVVGEATPFYLFHPDVPGRVRAVLPQVKIIALLRNPIDRAYSHYHLTQGRGNEPLSFEDAIALESERLGSKASAWRRHSYLSRGVYVDQMRRWLDVFPREQIHVAKSEDLYQNPERTLHETLAFLNLSPENPTRFAVHNFAAYSTMESTTRRKLAEFYAPYNRQLYELLDRDFGWDEA